MTMVLYKWINAARLKRTWLSINIKSTLTVNRTIIRASNSLNLKQSVTEWNLLQARSVRHEWIGSIWDQSFPGEWSDAGAARRCGGGVAGGGWHRYSSSTSVGRVRARRDSLPCAMRCAATTSAVPAAPAPVTSNTLGARRQKTDLHVAEPSIIRSSSPAPSLRSQRAKQYRCSRKKVVYSTIFSRDDSYPVLIVN